MDFPSEQNHMPWDNLAHLLGMSRLSTIRPVNGDDRLMTFMPLECGSNYSRKGFPHIDGTCALKFTLALSFSLPCH